MSGNNSTIETEITKMFGIKYPILLAGMNKAAGPQLAAAVTNAGGLGVIGGVFFTPRILRLTVKILKKHLKDKNAPFGIDLLLPKVGKGARATNYDYTHGQLDELIDVVIESGAKLFVSAVGVPSKDVVDKLHKNNVFVMNMVGAPKHVKKACEVGVDLICAQGGEGGGHTGSVPTSLLLPKCVDIVRENNLRSPLTNKPVYVVGAGGIYDGRGLAMALSYGCEGVWVGTRFVCSKEAGASLEHKNAIIKAGYDDTVRSLIYTGRPLRVVKNPYQRLWDHNRTRERDRLLKQGIIPVNWDKQNLSSKKKLDSSKISKDEVNSDKNTSQAISKAETFVRPHLAGQVSGAINDILPASVIIQNMMNEAVQVLQNNNNRVKTLSKL